MRGVSRLIVNVWNRIKKSLSSKDKFMIIMRIVNTRKNGVILSEIDSTSSEWYVNLKCTLVILLRHLECQHSIISMLIAKNTFHVSWASRRIGLNIFCSRIQVTKFKSYVWSSIIQHSCSIEHLFSWYWMVSDYFYESNLIIFWTISIQPELLRSSNGYEQQLLTALTGYLCRYVEHESLYEALTFIWIDLS
jgi:hypothetical protein